ncbi:MAG TPA: PH domain-containing protein [Rhizomicrobium sp.]|nr:PH domain-containing protein [Rhizomicrobium sp.]
MSYVETTISPGESIRFLGRVHWWIYVPAALLFVLGIFFISLSDDHTAFLRVLGGLCILVAIIKSLRDLIYSRTTELAVTNRRVIGKWGLIRRDTIEQRLDTMDATLVHQSIFGRIFDFGTIVVRGSGTTNTPIQMIANPLGFKKAVDVAAAEFESRTNRASTN